MNRLNKLLAPALAAALTLGAAVPASAAAWVQDARQLRSQIIQLDRQIDRAEQRRLLSSREANQLERRVENLKDLHSRYARNGFTRAELRVLDQRIDTVKRQVDREIDDRDGRRNNSWHDDHRDYNRR
jgi:chromosome segregation ATPase